MTHTENPTILVRYQDEDETYKYFWEFLNDTSPNETYKYFWGFLDDTSPSFDSAAEAETWLINNEENNE